MSWYKKFTTKTGSYTMYMSTHSQEHKNAPKSRRLRFIRQSLFGLQNTFTAGASPRTRREAHSALGFPSRVKRKTKGGYREWRVHSFPNCKCYQVCTSGTSCHIIAYKLHLQKSAAQFLTPILRCHVNSCYQFNKSR
jgi:hypothetical protein